MCDAPAVLTSFGNRLYRAVLGVPGKRLYTLLSTVGICCDGDGILLPESQVAMKVLCVGSLLGSLSVGELFLG